MEIKDKQGVENIVTDHFSLLTKSDSTDEPKKIAKFFPNEQLLQIESNIPCYFIDS